MVMQDAGSEGDGARQSCPASGPHGHGGRNGGSRSAGGGEGGAECGGWRAGRAAMRAASGSVSGAGFVLCAPGTHGTGGERGPVFSRVS